MPQGKLKPVPHPQLIVDHTKVVFYNVFGSADFSSDIFVFQSLGNQLDDPLIARLESAVSVEIALHSFLRQMRMVLTLTNKKDDSDHELICELA